mgnify:FL=1
MEFFNKKQDVIDIKLTQFGRHKLSNGKFNPKYYAFFDDDIIYAGANAGVVERQNEAQERIKETPKMKPQICFSSTEKQFNSNYNLVLSGEETPYAIELQRDAEKINSMPHPIGTMDLNSEFVPSWAVQFLNGKISGSSDHLEIVEKNGGTRTVFIPQIESFSEIKYESIGTDNLEVDEIESEDALSSLALVASEEDLYTMIKIGESNGFFQKKNFDVEFYEVLEDVTGSTAVETLRPLKFSTPEVNWENSEPYPHLNLNYVEYYFDVYFDDEISDEITCRLDPTNEKLGVFADPRTRECQDIINRDKKKVFDIYEAESDDSGEIC